MPQLTSSADYPNNHQCGFQKGLSSLDASFVLQETINHYKERSDGTCVAFLDSSKAFDTVWHVGLLHKLSEIGIPPKVWLILDKIYSNARSCVLVNNIYSRFFRQQRGLCQGSILSPKLYVLFINDLLHKLSYSKKGTMILDVHISCPTQADDIAVISPTTSNMQDMLLTCQQYSLKWRFKFSSLKSQMINFCKDNDPLFLLYSKQLPSTNSIKHVGITLNKHLNNWDRTLEACKTIKSTSMAILHSGGHPCGLNPYTSLKLINSLCLSKALYGCALWNAITDNEILALERAFRFAIKNIQGLPKRTRTDICLGLIGTISVEAKIDTHKLYFLGHLLRCPTWTLPYKIITSRLSCFKYKCVSSPVGFAADIYRILSKYDLISYLNDYFKTSVFPPKQIWKRIIKLSVLEIEETKWKTNISSSPDTKHFLDVLPKLEMHQAWKTARSNPYLKEQAHHIISICASWRPNTSKGTCSICNTQYSDLLIHVINSCQYLSKTRDLFWCSLMDIGPTELSTELHNLPDNIFIIKLLSCIPPINVDNETAKLYSEIVIHFVHLLSQTYFQKLLTI